MVFQMEQETGPKTEKKALHIQGRTQNTQREEGEELMQLK